MKVIALVPGLDHVCCRYRMAPLESRLSASDIQLTLAEIPDGWRRRLQLYRQCLAYDVVVLQRELLNWLELKFLSHFSRRLIFDYDDALWLRDSYSSRGFYSAKRERRFRRIIRSCDDVFAGNDHLADEALQRNPTVRVHVVPTCVNLELYPLAKHQSQDIVRLVWVGSASTLQGLEQFRDVLEHLGQQMPNLTLRLICDRFLQFQHLRTEHVLWSESTEAKKISECDIGISWIPDDPWSRGKCGLKILQYQAAGLPVVANPVGVHPKMLKNVGRLATATSDWLTAIRELAENVALRQYLGQQAREQVNQHYSTTQAAQLWAQALRQPLNNSVS